MYSFPEKTGYRRNFNRNSSKPISIKKEVKEEEAENEVKFHNESEDCHKKGFQLGKIRHWRLIFRNLPFKTKKEDIEEICSKLGPCAEIVLPKCKDVNFPNSCAGYAFVQFIKKKDAEIALASLNMSKVNGRTIAVDWAVPKDTFETAKYDEQEMEKTNPSSQISKIEEKPLDEEEMMAEEEIIDEEDDEDVSAEKSFSTEANNKVKKDFQTKSSKPKVFKEEAAISEGRVVFIRNLSFETTDETLKQALEKFGEVVLAIICRYKESDHSKGTAFVYFKEKENANDCINFSLSGEGILVDGRRVYANHALSRESAANLDRDRLEKRPKDKRNLHLLRASVIRVGTGSAQGMSETDAVKRDRLIGSARKKLSNLHMFISPTRLVVHNLPLNLTDKSLRSICFLAAGNPDAKITECRIWRDRSKVEEKSISRSRGFGFVSFSEHSDALAALKNLNNNPETFTDEKRPIVEFSIENLAALRLREFRLTRSKKGKITDLSEQSKRDLEMTKKQLSSGGRKPLPSHTGPKIRHKNQKTPIKKKNLKKAKSNLPAKRGNKRKKNSDEGDSSRKKRRLNKTKQMTKYLTLT